MLQAKPEQKSFNHGRHTIVAVGCAVFVGKIVGTNVLVGIGADVGVVLALLVGVAVNPKSIGASTVMIEGLVLVGADVTVVLALLVGYGIGGKISAPDVSGLANQINPITKVIITVTIFIPIEAIKNLFIFSTPLLD